MSYTYGTSKPDRPVTFMTATEIRAEAERVREEARQATDFHAARHDLIKAHHELTQATRDANTWQQRMLDAEQIRQTAFERNGDTPDQCRARLDAATKNAEQWRRTTVLKH